MTASEQQRDVYRSYSVPDPHFTGFCVVGPDGATMFVGRDEPYRHVTEIRLYLDASRTEEALLIRSRRMADIAPVYDVWDSASGARIGVLRRMRNRSILCDEWAVICCEAGPAVVKSRGGAGHAFIRRALCGAVGCRYHIYMGGKRVGAVRERKTSLGHMYIETDFTRAAENGFDRRLGIAAGVLLVMEERP